jgi:hypothetical protein
LELNPPPDPAEWVEIENPGRRLRVGLESLYAWYEQNEDMFSCVFRDAEVDPVTREVVELRGTEPMSRIRRSLAEGLGDERPVQAALDLALDFHAWRRLWSSGLDPAEAADLMAAAVLRV